MPFLVGCSSEPDPIIGTWVSVDAQGPPMTYVFGEDGSNHWILDTGQGPDTFALAYRISYDTTPVELDVGPWDSGPIAGRTLYGILEFNGPDRFRLDFEPGDPQGDGSERPTEFTEQTVTFVRKR